MCSLAKDNIDSLSISERIQLVEDIWDSIAAEPDTLPLSAEQRQELDRRLKAYQQNPEQGSRWENVRERITASK